MDSDFMFYWCKTPGIFVNKRTGEKLKLSPLVKGPLFSGTQDEWNETLIETIHDMCDSLNVSEKVVYAGTEAMDLITTSCAFNKDLSRIRFASSDVLIIKTKSIHPREVCVCEQIANKEDFGRSGTISIVE